MTRGASWAEVGDSSTVSSVARGASWAEAGGRLDGFFRDLGHILSRSWRPLDAVFRGEGRGRLDGFFLVLGHILSRRWRLLNSVFRGEGRVLGRSGGLFNGIYVFLLFLLLNFEKAHIKCCLGRAADVGTVNSGG